MFGIPATLIGATGTAVLLASLAPVALGGNQQASTALAPAHSVKADRISPPIPAQQRTSVSSVEVVGVSNATVILRDRSGAVLYRSDPLTNTTLVAKDADLPVVTLKEESVSPVVRQPVPSREGNEVPATKGRTKSVPGCEAPVSPLASQGRDRMPGLCLVEAFHRRVI